MKKLNQNACRTLLLVLMAAATSDSRAATGRTWDGSHATSGNWTTAANWVGGVAPVAGDILSFPEDGLRKTSTTNNFPAGTAFSTINVFGTGWRLRGNSVTISNYVSAGNPAGTNQVDLDLTAAGPGVGLTLRSFDSDARLTLTGDINLNGRNLTTEGPADFILSGVISGAGNLIKNNTGDLTLSGSSGNTYTGTTFVNAGVLRLSKAIFLLPGPVTVPRVAVPGDLVIGTGPGGIIGDIVVLNYNNQIADTSDVTVNGSGELALDGNTDTIGSLTMTGGHVYTQGGRDPGGLTLAGDVRINSGIDFSVIDGRLDLGAGTERLFDVVQGGYVTVNAQVTGGPDISLVKSNRGDMILTASNLFSGDVSVLGGTLNLQDGRALGDTNGITRLGLGTIILHEVGVVDVLEVAGPNAVLTVDSSGGSWNGSVILNDDLTISVPTNRTLSITGQISGPGGWTKNGPGTFTIRSTFTHTYTGHNRVQQGRVFLENVFNQVVVPGPLTIGDGIGGPGADDVQYLFSNGIGDTSPVTINSSGSLLMVFRNDTIGSLSGSGSVDLGSGTLTVGANNTSTLFSGVISGVGSLVKTGSATLRLTGANTYSGVTSNLNGTLLVDGSLNSTAVQVRPGSVLGGIGQVQAVSVFVNGTIRPGASPGNLSASTVLFPLGTLDIELNGLVAGASYDQLTSSGTVTLGGTLQVALGFIPPLGSSFRILNKTSAGAIMGTFNGLAEGATFAADGLLFQITYAGGTGNDVVLTRVGAPASDISSITPATSERMQILGQGVPFVSYVLEATPHLNTPIPWIPIATNTANALGIYEFIDAYADGGINLYPQRFYRVLSP